MKKIRKMICIATITLMACFACTACGTTYQEDVLRIVKSVGIVK